MNSSGKSGRLAVVDLGSESHKVLQLDLLELDGVDHPWDHVCRQVDPLPVTGVVRKKDRFLCHPLRHDESGAKNLSELLKGDAGCEKVDYDAGVEQQRLTMPFRHDRRP